MARGTFPKGNAAQLLSLVAIIGPFFRFRRGIGLLHSEQFAAVGELLLAVAVAQETVVADTLKSLGQDMDEKTPDELPGVERHPLLSSALPLLLPSQPNPAILTMPYPT